MKIFHRTWIIDRWTPQGATGFPNISGDFSLHLGMTFRWQRLCFEFGAGGSQNQFDRVSSRKYREGHTNAVDWHFRP